MFDRICGSIFLGLVGALMLGACFQSWTVAAIGFIGTVCSFNNFLNEEKRDAEKRKAETEAYLNSASSSKSRRRSHSQSRCP